MAIEPGDAAEVDQPRGLLEPAPQVGQQVGATAQRAAAFGQQRCGGGHRGRVREREFRQAAHLSCSTALRATRDE
jgi:hypothetical protein